MAEDAEDDDRSPRVDEWRCSTAGSFSCWPTLFRVVLDMNRVLSHRCVHVIKFISARHTSSLAKHKLSKQGLEVTLYNGRKLEFTIGQWARMADASATGRCGDTTVMVTGVASKTPSGPVGSFVPLTVDYRQRAAAAGRIPTNHLRRELGPTEKEILISRMIDRSIRPCFPKEFTHETQIICNLLAMDSVNDPEVLSLNTASVALACSPIPWSGPIGAVRVIITGANHEIIVNPTRLERAKADMDIVIAGTESKNVVMIEASASKPVELAHVVKAIVEGQKNVRHIVQGIEKLAASLEVQKRPLQPPEELLPEIKTRLKSLVWDRLWTILSDSSYDKQSRDDVINQLREESFATITNELPDVKSSLLSLEFSVIFRELYVEMVTKTGLRADGRNTSEIRPLKCKVSRAQQWEKLVIFKRMVN